jgi:hypothetical protein
MPGPLSDTSLPIGIYYIPALSFKLDTPAGREAKGKVTCGRIWNKTTGLNASGIILSNFIH